SFFSLILLNAKSARQRGTLCDFADTSKDSSHVDRFDRALMVVAILTLIMFLTLLLVIIALVVCGMNRRVLGAVSIFTGGFFIIFLLFNDYNAARAFVHCSRIQPYKEDQVGDLQEKLRDYEKRLEETTK